MVKKCDFSVLDKRIYNAYTVQLILNNYPTKSIKDIADPWGKKNYSIGKKIQFRRN
jgi:hypothetical protein